MGNLFLLNGPWIGWLYKYLGIEVSLQIIEFLELFPSRFVPQGRTLRSLGACLSPAPFPPVTPRAVIREKDVFDLNGTFPLAVFIGDVGEVSWGWGLASRSAPTLTLKSKTDYYSSSPLIIVLIPTWVFMFSVQKHKNILCQFIWLLPW